MPGDGKEPGVRERVGRRERVLFRVRKRIGWDALKKWPVLTITKAVKMIEIQKNSKERLRFGVVEFKGLKLVDVRVYYEDAMGAWKPSRKGWAEKKSFAAAFLINWKKS